MKNHNDTFTRFHIEYYDLSVNHDMLYIIAKSKEDAIELFESKHTEMNIISILPVDIDIDAMILPKSYNPDLYMKRDGIWHSRIHIGDSFIVMYSCDIIALETLLNIENNHNH